MQQRKKKKILVVSSDNAWIYQLVPRLGLAATTSSGISGRDEGGGGPNSNVHQQRHSGERNDLQPSIEPKGGACG